MDQEDDDEFVPPEVGPCCACGKENETVRNILMLDFAAPVPGKGWGCLAYDLPCDGAVAVLCDRCYKKFRRKKGKRVLRFIANGYLSEGRVPIDEIIEIPFRHDPSKHKGEFP